MKRWISSVTGAVLILTLLTSPSVVAATLDEAESQLKTDLKGIDDARLKASNLQDPAAKAAAQDKCDEDVYDAHVRYVTAILAAAKGQQPPAARAILGMVQRVAGENADRASEIIDHRLSELVVAARDGHSAKFNSVKGQPAADFSRFCAEMVKKLDGAEVKREKSDLRVARAVRYSATSTLDVSLSTTGDLINPFSGTVRIRVSDAQTEPRSSGITSRDYEFTVVATANGYWVPKHMRSKLVEEVEWRPANDLLLLRVIEACFGRESDGVTVKLGGQ